MTRGEAMRAARKKAGLSLRALGMRSGVPHKTICCLEKGHRQGQISTIELLADSLGISIDEYVGHKIAKPEVGIRLEHESESNTYLVYAGEKLLGRAVDMAAVKDLIHFGGE